MTLTFTGVVIDCADPAAVADFWQQALGWSGRGSGSRGEVILEPQEGETTYGPPSLVFQPVPEGKAVKNRVHLDFHSADQAGGRGPPPPPPGGGGGGGGGGQGDDKTFVVLADVEGNEFCVLSEA